MGLILTKKNQIANEIRSLALKRGISYVGTPFDELADHFTRLSGDDVSTLDEAQLLLLALRRAGVLTKKDAMRLQADYFAAKKLDI